MTRREYVPVASTKTSLFSTVTAPPVPENEVYACGHIGSFKQVSSHRIAPIPPFGAAAGVVANWRSRDRDVEARRSSKDASPECSQFVS